MKITMQIPLKPAGIFPFTHQSPGREYSPIVASPHHVVGECRRCLLIITRICVLKTVGGPFYCNVKGPRAEVNSLNGWDRPVGSMKQQRDFLGVRIYEPAPCIVDDNYCAAVPSCHCRYFVPVLRTRSCS